MAAASSQPARASYIGASYIGPAWALHAGQQQQQLQYPAQGAAAAAAGHRGSTPMPAPLPLGLVNQLRLHRPPTAAAQRRRGCQHCVGCSGLWTHVHTAADIKHSSRATGRLPTTSAAAPGHAEGEEWWPGGLPSPALYFHLRERQLQHNIRAARTPYTAAQVWRPAAAAEMRPAAAALLTRRRQRQLSLQVPAAYTNIQAGDTVELVGAVDVQLRRPSPPPMAPPPAVFVPVSSGAALLPSFLHGLPPPACPLDLPAAKRTRLSPPPSAMGTAAPSSPADSLTSAGTVEDVAHLFSPPVAQQHDAAALPLQPLAQPQWVPTLVVPPASGGDLRQRRIRASARAYSVKEAPDVVTAAHKPSCWPWT